MRTCRNRNLLMVAIFIALIVFGWYKNSSSPVIALAAVVKASGRRQSMSGNEPAAASSLLEIGGQKVIRLERKPTSGETKPEFLFATILPGRGMNLLQITAYQPGKGTIQIFATPSLQEAAQILNAETPQEHGVKGFTFEGGFIAPYANRVRGKLSTDRRTISTQWRGQTLHLPAVWKGKSPNAELHAIHGLILDRKADLLKIETTPDGQTATGIIHAKDFGGYWLSKTDLTISVALSGQPSKLPLPPRMLAHSRFPRMPRISTTLVCWCNSQMASALTTRVTLAIANC